MNCEVTFIANFFFLKGWWDKNARVEKGHLTILVGFLCLYIWFCSFIFLFFIFFWETNWHRQEREKWLLTQRHTTTPLKSYGNLLHLLLKVIMTFEWNYSVLLYYNSFLSPLYVCLFLKKKKKHNCPTLLKKYIIYSITCFTFS